jgi:hypothetical protein
LCVFVLHSNNGSISHVVTSRTGRVNMTFISLHPIYQYNCGEVSVRGSAMYAVLCCAKLYYAMPWYILCHAVLMLCCMLCYAMPCYAVLCHVCHAMYAMLCHAMLVGNTVSLCVKLTYVLITVLLTVLTLNAV